VDIEGAFSILSALLYWRVLASLFLSAMLAYCASLTGWASAPQLIVIAFADLLPGAAWQAKAEGTATKSGPSDTSPTVAAVTAVLIGCGWGLASSGAWHHVTLGALVGILLGIAWWALAVSSRHWFSPRAAASYLLASCSAFLVTACAASAA
jgi:hypothetical protein